MATEAAAHQGPPRVNGGASFGGSLIPAGTVAGLQGYWRGFMERRAIWMLWTVYCGRVTLPPVSTPMSPPFSPIFGSQQSPDALAA